MVIHESSILVYKDIEKSENHIFKNKIRIKIQFDYFPKVTIELGDFNSEPYKVLMFQSNGELLHSSEISTGLFTMAFRRWIDDMNIFIYNKKGFLVKKFNLFETISSGKVLISVESSSLGDTLAWIPYVHLFAKKHNCSDITVTTFWNDLFSDQYPELKFKHPGYREPEIDVLIGVGWYNEEDRNFHKVDPRTIPLQKVASDILGVEYAGEIKPRIKRPALIGTPIKKKICIGVESTAGAKHWNHPGGWQKLVDMLVETGYEVEIIQKQPTDLINVVNKTGDIHISERINDLLQCEFFIGVSSGLSWLAWALDVPVVLISGFTKPFCEFSEKTLRIIDETVCNGCFNDPQHKFDRGDWWWCPVNKNTERHFECTKSITPQRVFQEITIWRQSL